MSSLIALALLATPAPAPVQEEPDQLLEGHSGHGEVFNEGPRQAAYLMERPKSVHFPVTVRSEEAQAFFDQGVGQLHGFWYFEAERSFRQVAMLDPDCAMAYWGMAMANVDNAERSAGFARVAWLKRGLVTDRERRYIDAIARFRGVEGPEELDEPPADAESADAEPADERPAAEERAARLVRDYEELIWDYPDDIEAKALLVNRLWMNRYAGIPTPSRMANEALLQEIFAVQPEHPAHHYRIHLWDDPETAARVVESALRSGPSWPSVAHMWHMGGHIFARLGRHSDAAWQQEASARVDHAYMIRDRVLPDQIHNFAHNNEWLTRSLRHHGRVREAVALAKNMIELPRHPAYNMLDKRGCSASYGRRRLLETLELFEQWETLVELGRTMYLEPSAVAVDRAQRAYSLAQAHAFLGQDEAFEAELAGLEAMLREAKDARAAALEEAEEEALAAKREPADVRAALEETLAEHEDELAELRDQLATLGALRGVLRGEDVPEHLAALRELRYPRAHLARLFLEAGLDDEALELAREAVEGKPGQLYPHATLAYVLHATGHRDEALEVFDELREWTARADLDLPVFQRLAPLAAARDLPADWRVPDVPAADVAERPDLATLGPLRWTPPVAPAWTAPDRFEHEVSLSDYRGRPVVVIFFLGFGCVHCIEQLLEFSPHAGEFAAAGIDLVAIGTDSVQELADSQEGDTKETGYPFPLLADPGLELFKRYRAYDDFEDMPLHGTFLVDAEGRMRWQDISYEPFMDWRFLLAESQRLLGLPVAGEGGEPLSQADAGAATQAPTVGGSGGR